MKYLLVFISVTVAFFTGFFINQNSICQATGFESRTISASEFSRRLSACNSLILDIRTEEEFKTGHLTGAVNTDFYQSEKFSQYLDTLDKNKTYFIYCRTGNRSGQAMQQMLAKGFTSVINLNGGITAWTSAGLPVIK